MAHIESYLALTAHSPFIKNELFRHFRKKIRRKKIKQNRYRQAAPIIIKSALGCVFVRPMWQWWLIANPWQLDGWDHLISAISTTIIHKQRQWHDDK